MDKGVMPQPDNQRQGAANAEAPPKEDQSSHEKAPSEGPVLPPRLPLYTPTKSP